MFSPKRSVIRRSRPRARLPRLPSEPRIQRRKSPASMTRPGCSSKAPSAALVTGDVLIEYVAKRARRHRRVRPWRRLHHHQRMAGDHDGWPGGRGGWCGSTKHFLVAARAGRRDAFARTSASRVISRLLEQVEQARRAGRRCRPVAAGRAVPGRAPAGRLSSHGVLVAVPVRITASWKFSGNKGSSRALVGDHRPRIRFGGVAGAGRSNSLSIWRCRLRV